MFATLNLSPRSKKKPGNRQVSAISGVEPEPRWGTVGEQKSREPAYSRRLGEQAEEGSGSSRRKAVEQLATTSEDAGRVVLATGRYIGEGFDDPRLDTLLLRWVLSR